MEYKKFNIKKLLFVVFISLILCIVFINIVGNILVIEEAPLKSDIIVVLMGSIPDRILQGIDLYKEGYSKKIIMAEEHKIGKKILEEKNINVSMGEEINKLIALKLGIPEKDIVIIDGDTKSTQDEAKVIRNYLKSHTEISSIIIVTSKYHSFRAKKIFQKALDSLNRDITITSCPTKYDEFNAKKWWEEREDTKKVIFEVLKLINFYMREQFKL